MRPTDPEWLEWARELQALAQTGLTFTRDPYDRERYERLRHLSARMSDDEAAALTAASISRWREADRRLSTLLGPSLMSSDGLPSRWQHDHEDQKDDRSESHQEVHPSGGAGDQQQTRATVLPRPTLGEGTNQQAR